MKYFLLICVFAFVATVHSASVRNTREVPVVNDVVVEKEIVSELRKDPVVEVAIENSDNVETIVKEAVKEAVVEAVEALRSVQPEVAVAEPIALIMEKETPAADAIVMDIMSPAVETVDQVKETVVADAIPEADADKITKVLVENEEEADAAVRQDSSTPRPGLLQQAISNIVNNNPIAAVIQGIRQPGNDETAGEESASESTEAAAGSSTSRPNLIQQFQNNLQSVQHQIQTAFQNVIPGGAGGGGGAAVDTQSSGDGTTARPGLIQQFQQTFQQALNRPGQIAQSIFRPNQAAGTTTGNTPAADPVTEQKEGAAPVPVVNEKVELVDNKVDDEKKEE